MSNNGTSDVDYAASLAEHLVITQGIEMAVGLQSKFDWAGVAAAGIGGGVGAEVGDAIGYTPGVRTLDNAWRGGVASMAGGIAGAATRSLINGTDFGDNLMQVLPGVIGNTIGDFMAAEVSPQQVIDLGDGNKLVYTPGSSQPAPLTEAVSPGSYSTALASAAFGSGTVVGTKITIEQAQQRLRDALPAAREGISSVVHQNSLSIDQSDDLSGINSILSDRKTAFAFGQVSSDVCFLRT